MECTKCGVDGTRVKNTTSLTMDDGPVVIRTRKCSNPSCQHTFPTFEKPGKSEALDKGVFVRQPPPNQL
jgi:transcriptional regulator NrdR family protein